MNRLIPVLWLMLAAVIIGGSIGMAARANANPVDCYTQSTYNGYRTTCYSGYPDYVRTITDCDGSGRCTIRDAS